MEKYAASAIRSSRRNKEQKCLTGFWRHLSLELWHS